MAYNFKIGKKIHKTKIDSVTSAKERGGLALDVLYEAYKAWDALEGFRREARRTKKYVFGDQWGDYIENNGEKITEEEYIKRQGKIPLKNNRMRSIVRSILGQFSLSQTQPICYARDRNEQKIGEIMSIAIEYAYQRNSLWELDRRNFEYFIISGIAAFRTGYKWFDTDEIMDVYCDAVNINTFFFDRYMKDPRMQDCSFVGQIHDLSINEIIGAFSKGSAKRAEELFDIYRHYDGMSARMTAENLTGRRLNNISFFTTDDNRCRVIEVWKKESKSRLRCHDRLNGEFYKVELEKENDIILINQNRRYEQSKAGVLPEDMRLIEYEFFVDNYWYYRFLSPFGDILSEGETPYWHKSHPYSFKIYPFYDSEVHSLMSDIIDQQRYINRLITMQDFIMSSSAKGVLMFPEELKPDGMSFDEIAEEWVKYNGVIFYRSRAGVTAKPEQIVANSRPLGIIDALRIQFELLDEISGVSNALRGQEPKSNTPASLYVQQAQNSTTTLIDLFESYRDLREKRDTLIMKLQQQYYTEKRYMNIGGSNYSQESKIWDPIKVRNVEADLSLQESTSTPVYRMIMNEFLMDMFKNGAINIEQMLEVSELPFSEKLMQSLAKYKEEAIKQQEAIKKEQEMLRPETYGQYEANPKLYTM